MKWQDKETDRLMAWSQEIPLSEIARRLNRYHSTVRRKAIRLKIDFIRARPNYDRRPWTEAEEALLKSGTIHNKGTGKLIEEYASAVCFWGAGKNRRIGFITPNGEQRMSADFDCVLVYFGRDWRKFNTVFSPYGHVMPTAQTVNKLLDLR